MKDNFSDQSEKYARFRPGYPKELFPFIENELQSKERAWDCGTGNGQVAVELSKFMKRVDATDISREQLNHAVAGPNIFYSQQPAENTSFPDESFDLITVAQAIHWFNFEEFYAEVNRCLKPGGFIAVMGYGLFHIDQKTDQVIQELYSCYLEDYWDPERRYLEEEYQTIPFPFDEIETPSFEHRLEWDFEHLIGYLKSWSAVKHYQKAKGRNPVDLISKKLYASFGERGIVTYPVLFRLGKHRTS